MRFGLLILLLLPVNIAFSQPAYINDMAPLELRSLSGVYAPTNGNTELADAILAVDPTWANLFNKNHITNMTGAWNGGAADESRRILYLHGGGHGDGAYNGIVQFDFNGTSAPIGFSVVPGSASDPSAVPPLPAGGSTYSDGRPASVHSYDGMQYDLATNQFIRVGGSIWSGTGSLTRDTWAFDFDTNSWNQLSDSSISTIVQTPASVFNTSVRKLMHINDGAGTAKAEFLDIDTGTWSGAANAGFIQYSHFAVFDPVRNQVLVLRDGSHRLIHTIDWSAHTFSHSDLNITGATVGLEDNGISAVFDPVRDSIWVFGGRQISRFSKIWEITNLDDPGRNFVITQYSLSGDSYDDTGTGLYSRFIFFNDWRAIGFVPEAYGPAFVLRLPGSGGTPPPDPPDPPGGDSETPSSPNNLRVKS